MASPNRSPEQAARDLRREIVEFAAERGAKIREDIVTEVIVTWLFSDLTGPEIRHRAEQESREWWIERLDAAR